MIGARLGWLSMFRERASLLFTAVAMASILGPLLVLLGLKNGVAEAMLATLRNDPSVLQIQFRGHASLTPYDVNRIRNLPGIGFLIPDVSSIAAEINFTLEGQTEIHRSEAWPTAVGDPLLPHTIAAPGAGEVIFTQELARRMRLAPGQRVVLLRERQLDSRIDILRIPLRVSAILPPNTRITGTRSFLDLATIETIQSFVDGYATNGAQGRPLEERPKAHERLRLYTKDLLSVAPLTAEMEKLGYEVTSRAAEVESILRLDRNLALLFNAIATMSAIGYLVSFWASLTATLARRRRELSLLRLMGGTKLDLLSFGASQGILIAVTGVAISFLVYGLLAFLINDEFPVANNRVPACFLTPIDLTAATVAPIAVVLLVTFLISRPLLRISPSEVLHNG